MIEMLLVVVVIQLTLLLYHVADWRHSRSVMRFARWRRLR